MKVLQLGLNQQSPVVVYDKTKPYMAGRVAQRTIGGQQVYGPPLTGFINTFNDTASGVLMSKATANGRLFQLLSITAGLATISLHIFDYTGATAPQYVGKILVRVPNTAATTHTMRGFEVWDGANSGVTTGWQIYLGTVGTVLINGGLFVVNNISQSDFSPLSPPTIEMAVASNAKAVYMMQDSAAIGVNNTLTAMQGLSHDRTNRRLYFHNNVLATTQFAVLDGSATPNLVLQTTTAATSSGSPTFTLTGHGYNANDPVVITANAPTGFTASTSAAAQTVYFIRNPTANTFELSATSGGASINATSITSGTVVTRAFGQTISNWLNIRTGTVTGFVGTFLLTNAESYVTPLQSLDASLPVAFNNVGCLFLATSSNFYLVKVSEITNGATTFPTMITVNALGTGTDYTAVTPAFAQYSETTGRIVIVSNSSQFYVKQWQNSAWTQIFGGLNTSYLENGTNVPYTFAGVTIVNLDFKSGYAFAALSTTGQRGILYMDFRSDANFNYSFLTTPVKDTSQVQSMSSFFTREKLFDLTASMVFSYKTSANSTDAVFNDPTTGWTMIPIATDLSGYAINNFTQLRVDFITSEGNVNTPAQINEIFLAYTGKNEISDNWAFSSENSTRNGASPAYSAFVMLVSDSGKKYFRAYSKSTGALVAQANTTDDFSLFDKSTNNGTSWAAMASANDYSNTAGTTEIRYKWPGTIPSDVIVSLRDN